MRLPRRRSARLSACLATAWKMRLPDFCNRLTTRVPDSDRSILESPPPVAFARVTASAASGAAEAVSETRSSGARLTTRSPASASSRVGLSVSRAACLVSDLWTLIKGSSETMLPFFPAAFSTARRGRDPASDALCRDPLPRDVNPASKDRQDRFHRRLVKVRRPSRPRAPAVGDRSPTSATKRSSVSTSSDRPSLGLLARGCPRARSRASEQSPVRGPGRV
jgi:hypothetical protein